MVSVPMPTNTRSEGLGLAYLIVDAAPAGTNWIYFAIVKYATIGYGDIAPLPRWRLLGPIASMNGALMFGWSAAVIFEVMRKALRRGARQR